MAVTVNMGTLSQTRALLTSCLLTGLIVYTLSTWLQSRSLATTIRLPEGPPAIQLPEESFSGAEWVDLQKPVPHGISVFQQDNYEKHLVLPRMKEEDVSWLEFLPPDLHITPKMYLVDTEDPPPGALTTPLNKGHEAMVYLTYIIEHYDSLPDIVLFVHAHSVTWHNNDLQLASTPVMLLEMNYRRIIKEGYMNLRCHWQPGCPAWILTNSTEVDLNKKEEGYIRATFQELFPGEEIPDILSVACCAQFAVTKGTIRAHAKERYIKWRQWIFDTGLDDDLSGRIWEYLWQYVFPGPNRSLSTETKASYCPRQDICYCDGYGYCFGGEENYRVHFDRRERARSLSERLKMAEEDKDAIDDEWRREGMQKVRDEIKDLDTQNEAEVVQARIRGSNEKLRREELGSHFSG